MTPLCAYCPEESEYACANCDRRICWEHSHNMDGDRFCAPDPDGEVAHYIRTGENIPCGQGEVTR